MTDEPGITEIVHFLASPFTLADAEKLISGNEGACDCFWGVWLKSQGDLIGTIGVHLRDPMEIEIGYWLATRRHGQGLASEGVRAMLAALSEAYPDHFIVAECRPQNQASWRLLEKMGFRADGIDGRRDGRKRLTRVSRDQGSIAYGVWSR